MLNYVWKVFFLPLGQDHPKHPESGSQRGGRPHRGQWGPQKFSLSKQGTWTHLSSSPVILISGTLPNQSGTVSCMHLLCSHLHRGWTPCLCYTPLISCLAHSQAPEVISQSVMHTKIFYNPQILRFQSISLF